MLNYGAVRAKGLTLDESTAELAAGLTPADLERETHEMINHILELIANCTDADVVFQPIDPAAHDSAAATSAETDLAWTLGHVLVHITASSEEAAFIAAELARGVPFHGRSRYETHWTTIQTIAQCRQRLEESRRMRGATLSIWPDEPHLDNMETWGNGWQFNAPKRFVLGLLHDYDHLQQIQEIVRQAQTGR